MKHFPIYLDLDGKKVVLSGAQDTAAAKIKLLMKTNADIHVFGLNPSTEILALHKSKQITLHQSHLMADDVKGAVLVYGANDDAKLDKIALSFAKDAGVLGNIVDNLEASDFITPALVDRAPLTIAIGTEGAAPVLARKIKRDLEASLPASIGLLARIGQSFRNRAASLPMGPARRNFWAKFYFKAGPQALIKGGEGAVLDALEGLLTEAQSTTPSQGRVDFVGAGPGDPGLLTLHARNLLHEADVILHDQLVSDDILELARREAIVVQTGKSGFGPSWHQNDINALMIEHAQNGHSVIRLKSGDPLVFGRLDEETDALDLAEIPYAIVPGISSAAAAAASIGTSFTKRGRNSEVRFITGHDLEGFADHDWKALAKSGTVAAIFMGKRAAQFTQSRLLMHGRSADTPVTIVENASRKDQRVLPTTLGEFGETIAHSGLNGPALILLGLTPKAAKASLAQTEFQKLAGLS